MISEKRRYDIEAKAQRANQNANRRQAAERNA
jgi:hypothetical protein